MGADSGTGSGIALLILIGFPLSITLPTIVGDFHYTQMTLGPFFGSTHSLTSSKTWVAQHPRDSVRIGMKSNFSQSHIHSGFALTNFT